MLFVNSNKKTEKMIKGKYTMIENRWTKEIDGKKKTCFVHFYYNRAASPVPFVRLHGYNPFPCFMNENNLHKNCTSLNDFCGFYTTRTTFNKWMKENGWNIVEKTNDVIRKCETTF